ncbi:MAG: isoleucine--tRNA ligase [Candidatus Cloacimonetes bacterium]|nr:isoleucine--tRNA ligase [Candidatus Cloacimonadota bacterium]
MYNNIDIKEKASVLEKEIRKFWQDERIDEESVEYREGNEQFIFFEGPPTANGKPGIHHVLSRAIKDAVCRYKTMQGFQVKRKAGWDTHGLPVEIEVEKQLGLEDKKAILEYGIENFNKKCKESVFTYEKEWREMTRTMGYWVDLENPYITLKNSYIETVWWILNEFHKKNLIYKGYKISPYCPCCGTTLASHEVSQGYRDTEDPSIFVKFKQKGEENTYFLAWTTTPWTLISNVALAVHPKEIYVKILHNGENLILAKDRLSVIEGDYEVIAEFIGKSLEYQEYEQLFPYTKVDKKAFFIALADYVTMDDGTGIVHTAPAFGQDDYSLGVKYNLPVVQPVDEAGKFTAVVVEWAGIFVKDADKSIIKKLKETGHLYKRMQIMHSYPFCWRCESPLIYYARDSWYIKTSQFKEELMKNNAEVNWYPSFVGEKRFGEWLSNNIDWALSRERFWGTPLNIWVCEKCGTQESIGSIAELKEKGKNSDGSDVSDDVELHRPYIDQIKLSCPKCSSVMHRTPEVIDCWFDSGAMPFAQWHYPFENKDRFEKELFPANFICEGIDQTRGWFYSLLAISTILKGKSPYKNVLVNDLILDAKGQKMSKSKGNTLNPMQLMEDFGADAVRWYLLAVSPPWVPTKFDPEGVKEVISKFIGTLKNVYSFYATYANIDNFNAMEHKITNVKSVEIDRWIISRLNSVIENVTDFNDGYDFTRTLRMMQTFVQDDVSNWYVRRCRRRYWSMTLTEDKKDAYLTLFQVLVTVSKLIAPFAPFLSEFLYKNLTGGRSVHLTDYPQADLSVIDEKLEREMQIIIDHVSLGRAARNTCQIKVRQTLSALLVSDRFRAVIAPMEELIKEEINVKGIKYIKDKDNFVEYDFKINFKTLGPKYGKHLKSLGQAIANMDTQHILDAFKKKEPVYIDCDGTSCQITQEDLLISIKQKEGYVFESEKDIYIALDTHLTPELIEEGFARELVNKIQFTRKENQLDIMDRIRIFYFGDDEITTVFTNFADYIKDETLSNEFIRVEATHPDMKSWDVNGKEVFISISKV